ncbi:MAG: hypothetical protein E7388_07720 [Ruminococcaceae bacterium]|nr:hypothetical protein [Oscillospiraceae bacterium]
MKRKILILIFLSFVFVFAGNLVEKCYPEEVSAFTWSTPVPTATKKPIWNTPRPTASPEPTSKPTPTPTSAPTASPTAEVSATPDPFASPSPTPSPTPERPQLPPVAVPGLTYPATAAPEATLNPDAFQDDVTPVPTTPTPSPSPEVTEAPTKNKPTWSGLVKFVTVVFYTAAIITAVYALFFFIICTLFGKKPSSGFDLLKKKLKKLKNKKISFKGKARPKDIPNLEKENKTPVKFRRHEDFGYHPVIDTEDSGTSFETPEEEPEISVTTADEISNTGEFTIENIPESTISLCNTVVPPLPEENISEEDSQLTLTGEFDVFTADDLPSEEPVIEETDEDVELPSEENIEEDFTEILPDPPQETPKENKPLTFRRAIDMTEEE